MDQNHATHERNIRGLKEEDARQVAKCDKHDMGAQGKMDKSRHEIRKRGEEVQHQRVVLNSCAKGKDRRQDEVENEFEGLSVAAKSPEMKHEERLQEVRLDNNSAHLGQHDTFSISCRSSYYSTLSCKTRNTILPWFWRNVGSSQHVWVRSSRAFCTEDDVLRSNT